MKLPESTKTRPLYVMTAFCAVFYLFARYAPGFSFDERGMLFIFVGPISVFAWLIAAVNCVVSTYLANAKPERE